jgi:hypothetical protein
MDMTGMYDHAIRTHWLMTTLWSLITIAALTAGACVVCYFNHRLRHPRHEARFTESQWQMTQAQPEAPTPAPKSTKPSDANYMPREPYWMPGK